MTLQLIFILTDFAEINCKFSDLIKLKTKTTNLLKNKFLFRHQLTQNDDHIVLLLKTKRNTGTIKTQNMV